MIDAFAQKVVKETFTLAEVPRDALYLGLAGVLPYLATSLSTVYLAYDLNHAKIHGFGVFLDADAATFGLQIVEPIQLGYGAVVRIASIVLDSSPADLA